MDNFQLTTPVAFIIFNRPDTTEKVFEEIRRAKPPKLLVIADGPRGGRTDEADKCAQARAIIDTVDWECEVLTNYSEANLGCKMRVATGLDWVFSQVSECIIIEDDCVPDPSFFRFCQEMLLRYRDDNRIMMITGTNHLIDQYKCDSSYFFSRHFTIWGWATWKRAWSSYDVNMKEWRESIDCDDLFCVCSDWIERKHFEHTFDLIYKNKMDTWDIQWAFNCLFNHGLCITPVFNLIENIGVIGTHSSDVSDLHFLKRVGISFDLIHPRYVFPETVYDRVLFKTKLLKPVIKNQIKLIMNKHELSKKVFDIAKAIYKAIFRRR